MGSKPFDANQDEDTQAILTRRALLIRASLMGAGLIVGAEGCSAQVCLSNTPSWPIDVPEPQPDACLTTPDVSPKVDLGAPADESGDGTAQNG